jgi:CheY-like chemotaxis protein
VKILLVSSDAATRQLAALTVRGLERTGGEPVQFLEATDGVTGIAAAWKYLPDAVIADEIMSRAGAFALARDLKGATRPFPGVVVILLERSQDAWLASWSGADLWFVKPVNPFDLAERVARALESHHEEAV